MGTKYCGHDSALCLLDTEQKTVFAMSTERVTRIKHDSLDISPIVEAYDFGSVDYAAHSYSDFEDKGHDGELREKMTYNKDIEKALRSIIKPTYAADLGLSRLLKNICIFKSLFTNFSAVKAYYSAKFNRALVKETPEGNKRAFTNYIKQNFNKFNLRPKNIFEDIYKNLRPDFVFNCSHIHGKRGELPITIAKFMGFKTGCFIFKNR